MIWGTTVQEAADELGVSPGKVAPRPGGDEGFPARRRGYYAVIRCERCGIEFAPRNRNGVRARFCSPACRASGWRARIAGRTVRAVQAGYHVVTADGSSRFERKRKVRQSRAIASLSTLVNRRVNP